jgi:hypothetical protein
VSVLTTLTFPNSSMIGILGDFEKLNFLSQFHHFYTHIVCNFNLLIAIISKVKMLNMFVFYFNHIKTNIILFIVLKLYVFKHKNDLTSFYDTFILLVNNWNQRFQESTNIIN